MPATTKAIVVGILVGCALLLAVAASVLAMSSRRGAVALAILCMTGCVVAVMSP